MDPVARMIWLLSEGYLSFGEDDITWDGTRHALADVQVNPAKVDELTRIVASETDCSDVEEFTQFYIEYLAELESDESLVVPRKRISPALRDALREGDLTGITLANLAACGGAIRVSQTEGDDYAVSYDEQLALGIPAFFSLVARMLWDLRQLFHATDEGPFLVEFTPLRSADADEYIGDVRRPVAGAQGDPHDLLLEEAPKVELGNLPSDGTPGDDPVGGCGNAPGGTIGDDSTAKASPERRGLISLLKLFVASTQLSSSKARFPQTLLDELDRAEKGDTSVDLMNLARRMNEVVPDPQIANLSNASFEQAHKAQGTRFSIAVPEGWTVIKDYSEDGIGGTVARPFVIVEGDATAKDDLSMRDRVIYSSLMAMPQNFAQNAAKYGTRDFHWSFWWSLAFNRPNTGLAAFAPKAVWDAEVEAVNTYCLITQHSNGFGPNGLEFDVRPYANDHIDSLRFVFDAGHDVEQARQFVMSMARTIELDKPVVPECVAIRQRALRESVSPKEFNEMTTGYDASLISNRQSVFSAASNRYLSMTPRPTGDDIVVAGARGVAKLSERATRVLNELLDAYEAQVRLGASNQDLRKMAASVRKFYQGAFATPENFTYGNDAALIRANGTLDPTPEFKATRARLWQLFDVHDVAASKAQVTNANPVATARENAGSNDSHRPAGGAGIKGPAVTVESANMDLPALVLTLFSQDWLFFQDDEITWDGKHHGISGIQVNGDKAGMLMNWVDANFRGFGEIKDVVELSVRFLTEAEKDEGLVVPRQSIARGLRRAIRKGDLTGITLANLAACDRAIDVRNAVINGQEAYVVGYDSRLAMGIPRFFDLMARLLWDLRWCSDSGKGVPFTLACVSWHNFFGLNDYLGGVATPVAGAQTNPDFMLVEEQPAIDLGKSSTASSSLDFTGSVYTSKYDIAARNAGIKQEMVEDQLAHLFR